MDVRFGIFRRLSIIVVCQSEVLSSAIVDLDIQKGWSTISGSEFQLLIEELSTGHNTIRKKQLKIIKYSFLLHKELMQLVKLFVSLILSN